jgi:hypothetical protein
MSSPEKKPPNSISYPTIPFTKVSEEKTLKKLLESTPNASADNIDDAQTLLLYRLYPEIAPRISNEKFIEKPSPIVLDDDNIRAELVFDVKKMVKSYPIQVSPKVQQTKRNAAVVKSK